MKNILVIAFTLSTLSAFAITKVNRAASFDELSDAAQEAVTGTENGDGCHLEAKVSDRGLSLKMVTEKKTVEVFVPKSFRIRLTGSDDTDGSYYHNYSIAQKGSLALTHLDDAYFHTTLKNFETGESADCDIDF